MTFKSGTPEITAEVLLLDNEVAVFRSGTECKFYIAGPVEEVSLIKKCLKKPPA